MGNTELVASKTYFFVNTKTGCVAAAATLAIREIKLNDPSIFILVKDGSVSEISRTYEAAVSWCNPNDMPHFNNKLGKVIAYNRIHQNPFRFHSNYQRNIIFNYYYYELLMEISTNRPNWIDFLHCGKDFLHTSKEFFTLSMEHYKQGWKLDYKTIERFRRNAKR